jgi:hypothetical protein
MGEKKIKWEMNATFVAFDIADDGDTVAITFRADIADVRGSIAIGVDYSLTIEADS